MLTADNWKDYELIDCGGGERLERWKDAVLVRPDPQAIWPRREGLSLWDRPDARYSRSSAGGGKWELGSIEKDGWEIGYGGLKFRVKPMNFKHTGVFPEQAVNWDFTAGLVRDAGREISVLNLFGYTGCATLALLEAGASVCHVDAAKGMVDWARSNAALSGFAEKPVRWIVDDCMKFIEREIRRGKKYEGIIMDPPSYGRGPSGEIWKLEDDLYRLVSRASLLLSDRPLFFLLNTYTSGLAPSVGGYVVESVVGSRLGGTTESLEIGLKASATGLSLPCGATTRWQAD